MRTLYGIITVAICLIPLKAIAMGSDMKYLDKIYDQVMSIHTELFDPFTPVPDSTAERYSCVILSELDYLDAKHEVGSGAVPKTYIRSLSFSRQMVKLLDNSAVEEMSKFIFGKKTSQKVSHYKYADMKHIFGARIIKPDGSVLKVDLSEGFAVKVGKKSGKGKTSQYKIDIPGLEAGDVLDFFSGIDQWIQEFDLPPINFVVPTNYPVLNYFIEIKTSPELTVEYHTYNGATELQESIDEEGFNLASGTFTDIPVMTDRLFTEPLRTIPFYSFYVLNNTSHMRRYLSNRKGGIYCNLEPGLVFNDIYNYIGSVPGLKSELAAQIAKYTNEYLRQHPDAGRREVFDASWIAANYLNKTDKDFGYPELIVASIFCSQMLKAPMYASSAGVVFVNPHSKVPTREIAHWDSPSFGSMIEDTLYLCSSLTHYRPGELPGEFQGEEGGSYMFSPQGIPNLAPAMFRIKESTPFDNRITLISNLKILDDGSIKGSNELELKGATKKKGVIFNTTADWISSAEDYLGIPEKKRSDKGEGDYDEDLARLQEGCEEINGLFYGGPDAVISEVEIQSRGNMPGDPTFRMTYDIEIPDAITYAGDELIIPVGYFSGNIHRLDGVERKRQSDIYMDTPNQDYLDITFEIPEGYTVDPESLESLYMNVSNPVGAFFVQAVQTEKDKVCLKIRGKMNLSKLPSAAWPGVLELLDTRSSFCDAQLVLIPEVSH